MFDGLDYTERKTAVMKTTAREIKQIEDSKERYDALVAFIRPEHTEKSRWSIEAVADVANEYIAAEQYRDFCKKGDDRWEHDRENQWAEGQVNVLGRLLFENGWGWVVGIW